MAPRPELPPEGLTADFIAQYVANTPEIARSLWEHADFRNSLKKNAVESDVEYAREFAQHIDDGFVARGHKRMKLTTFFGESESETSTRKSEAKTLATESTKSDGVMES